ncbi:MAG: hypothetical protein FJ312_00675 [SAR202 cluster bacterium]|nr:hypothetical protein [SAR202 cluster bacterium]
MRILATVLLAALAASLLGFGPEPTPTPQQEGSFSETRPAIRMISSSHDIQFAERIVFCMEAEADSSIEEVTFYYRLGGKNVLVFGYPDFERGQHVAAEFEVDTGVAGGFLPSGIDIEYHYVIVDAAGRRLETLPQRLEYLNPRFGWQRLSLENFVMLWHDRPRAEAAAVAEKVNARLANVKALLGLGPTKRMKAVILNNPIEAQRSFPRVSQTASDEHLFGGFAFSEYDLFVLMGLDEDGIVHEMTHLLLDEAMDSRLAKVPAWLNEGLATYFERIAQRRDREVDDAVRDGDLLPLRAMGTVPGKPDDVVLFYAQSRDLVRYLIDERGAEGMTAVIRGLSAGTKLEQAVQDAYGVSLGDLEDDWRVYIGAEPLPIADGSTSPSVLGNEPDEPIPQDVADGSAQPPARNSRGFGGAGVVAAVVVLAAIASAATFALRHTRRPR